LRICLVSPFDWSQPHDVNEHVAGVAGGLRARGHEVTVLTPSSHARELTAGRHALLDGAEAETIALGPAIPISRRSRMGVTVGLRANLALALSQRRYEVVHGFEPGLPSLSYLALRDNEALSVATFLSEERLGYPPARAQRERLLGRIDALAATSEAVAEAAAVRFPGRYRIVSPGFDPELFAPAPKRRVVILEWRPSERQLMRAVTRALAELPDWELVLLRTKPLAGRPSHPRALRGRVSVRTARSGAARGGILAEAAVFAPALGGLDRVLLEARGSGCAIAAPPGRDEQPELVGAEVSRLGEDDGFRARRQKQAQAEAAGHTFADVAAELEGLYASLGRRRRPRPQPEPLAGRPWITVDLHMHTNWSHDCGVEAVELLDRAEAESLGAIAVTDHNVFGGALEALELSRGRDLVVIAGEEVKTDGQGEVIGLFLDREIPGGMSFADTVAAIREQSGLVYIPHPFDRMHAIPDPATLHAHLADIDVFEVYNARLLLDAYNDEALRFARKYNLTMGAGSDAHVLQGVGTGAVRMRRFDGPEEFLISLRYAEILRRPKSLAYLQSLKWVAQVKEKVR
jgi:hypothetical protein